jgi:formate dehydrogenase subunit gamma
MTDQNFPEVPPVDANGHASMPEVPLEQEIENNVIPESPLEAKEEEPLPELPAENGRQAKYVRFSIIQRLEHVIFLLSFSLLAFTGLPQKYADSTLGQGILLMFGGIENIRIIHHISATVMMVVSIYHILEVLYKVFVERTPFTMLPLVQDIQHVLQDIQFYFGMRKHRAYYGRYNYAEKAEYLALVWGTVIMGLTGFMMWNPITTARLLPGQVIPAAKAAHGAEAVLAVLAIILWHFYHVHIRHLNKSMFIGTMTHEEMEHEHPAELEEIRTRRSIPLPLPADIRKRQRIFFPFAGVLTLVFGFGILQFLTIEDTAITTIPRGETAAVFVPVTPTPRPTPSATPTLDPNQVVGADTWEGFYQALFRNRCDTCHGNTKVGGLTLRTYQDALDGGKSGPAIVPGDPDNSLLVQMQSLGAHPGQLTIDELERVIQWIEKGAPEK